jgi:hypothetical protein
MPVLRDHVSDKAELLGDGIIVVNARNDQADRPRCSWPDEAVDCDLETSMRYNSAQYREGERGDKPTFLVEHFLWQRVSRSRFYRLAHEASYLVV